MKDIYSYQLYIFDLDDTLYRETDYLFMAYDQIGEKFNEPAIADFLKEGFKTTGRKNLFDKTIVEFSLPEGSIDLMFEILRTIGGKTELKIFDAYKAFVSDLKKRNKKLAILTNGNTTQQQTKLELLPKEIVDMFEVIVFANELEPKPSAVGIDYILNATQISNENSLMIGDSETDFQAANKANIDFVYSKDILGLIT